MAKETERPSEDADERRSAKVQDLNPPTVPHVIRVPRATDTENEPRSSSSRPMERPKMGALVTTQPATKPSSSSSSSKQSDGTDRQNWRTARGLRCQARTAELLDEVEQGGKFLQVEGLTPVDAEEIPCEFSVEDDFVMDENTEGVNEEIVKAIGQEERA